MVLVSTHGIRQLVSDMYAFGKFILFSHPLLSLVVETICVPRTGYWGNRSAISLTKAASAWMDLRRFILQETKHGYKEVIFRSTFSHAWAQKRRERKCVCGQKKCFDGTHYCRPFSLLFYCAQEVQKQNNIQALCISPHVVSVASMTRDLCGTMNG